MALLVTKADGTTEPFKFEKLRRSLRRAGADRSEIDSICKELEPTLKSGMTTEEIYRRAFALLQSSASGTAARYSLRRALFGLGPTGFPFEDFLARLFEREGYSTKTRITLPGKCVDHELDVAAYRDDHSFVAEAKFHARPGIKSDLQVAMYSYARLLDLKDQKICTADHCGVQEFMIVTNTKFTRTAEKYAGCVGLTLLSWDFPRHRNLHDRIQAAGLYPVTVLQALSQAQKRTLINRGVIICSDILDNPRVLRHLHVSKKKHEGIVAEAQTLVNRQD